VTPRAIDLSGVRLKLARANEHIQTVRSQTDAFLKREPAPFDFRTDSTPGPDESIEYVLRAIVREKPPREIALPIGDAVQNMRSALDHLVYELATPKARKSIRLQFPIFSDECEFKVKAPAQIASITGDERTLIERVQPYAASNPPADNPLAILRKLSNLDKHKLLVPLVTAASLGEHWIASDNADITITFFEPGPVENDAKIMAFTARPQDPAEKMYVETHSGLHVQLGGTGATGWFDIDAVDMLESLHHHIERSTIDMWWKYGYMPPQPKTT